MAELKEHFEDAEIAELGLMIGQYMALGRMLVIVSTSRSAAATPARGSSEKG